MKKRLVMIILLILPILLLVNVKALSKNDMTTLNLKRIKSITTPSGGYNALQGGVTTDKYIVSIVENSKNGKNAIIVLDKEDYAYASIKGDNPIVNRKYGESTDLAFNSKTKETLVLINQKIYVLDEAFKDKNTISLEKNYHAIAYDEKDDKYVLASSTKEGSKISIVDNEFNEVSSYKIKHEFTGKSLTVKDNNIYYACYNKKTKENIIFIYDKEGNKQNIFLIPKKYNGLEYGELQNISFKGKKLILQFYKNNKINYYSQITSNKITDTPIKIKLNDKYENNKYTVNIYENGNKIDTIKNKGNVFTFNPKYTKTGTYKYKVKQELTNKNNVIYDEEEKDLVVDIKYNPATNKYETTYNEIVFNNTELAETNEKNNSKDDSSEVIIDNNGKKKETKDEELPGTSADEATQIVEVPDTASSSAISMVIGSIIILINIFIIRKTKIEN